ncbi:hypothetical protein HKX48_001761 [Thoreauomyces humboldtii]|nr:hypothetical protein HKX48_001761 [Thoreauomyces humboldtii]
MPATIFVPSQTAVQASTTANTATVELVGWGLAGAFVRTWALGMQRRPLLERPYLHLVFAAGAAGIGYFVSQYEKTQLAALEVQRDKLTRRRMMRLQQTEAA